MAQRIQAGERAKGKKDFWGYVWQGAAAEALTCNALEWQVAEGGGRIIEKDRTISVNNPAAIRTWQRAKRWIGWISPPGVVAYRERDSMNVFDSGGAAFDRIWLVTPITKSGQARHIGWRSSLPQVKTGFASMPAGPGGSAGTLGGDGLAVSQYSAHRKQVITLVRFLIRNQIQLGEKGGGSSGPTSQPEFYDPPSISAADLRLKGSNPHAGGIVIRPSVEAGHAYEQVTRAYFGAVHSVLTGERQAPEAAADLQKKLMEITGFRTGPPRTAP
jgi:trehalose/maltose transport system substrate-binding protein